MKILTVNAVWENLKHKEHLGTTSSHRGQIKGELMGCNETQLIIKLGGDRKLEKKL